MLALNAAATPRNIQPELRPYQRTVVGAVDQAVAAGMRRLLLVAPTGSGKTVVAGALVLESTGRVLLLAHRRELVGQASRKLHAVGVDHGIIAAGFPARSHERVQVASVQTLHARAVRGSAMELPAADLVIIDEAHHATARTWRRIIESYPDAVIVGLTATPCRSDGRGLGALFEALVECPQIPELIAAGYLVGTKVYAPTTPNLDGVCVRHGDYVESELAARVDTDKLVGDVVLHWFRLADRRRTIVFAVSVAHSVHLRDEFASSGVVAEHVDGTTPGAERDAILARLASGVTEVVCNCGVLTEGFDSPDVGVIVLARPTKSFGLYRQMIGRGLRPAAGKDHCLILDHSGATFEHGLVEEPVAWTLSPDERAARQPQGSSGSYRARTLTTCPECNCVRWSGSPCGACGWRPVAKPAPVEFVDADLVEVGKTRRELTADDRRAFHQQLAWIARERGYRPGWIGHTYRKKFGGWPDARAVEPVPATDETRAWVRSRQIAFARAQRA